MTDIGNFSLGVKCANVSRPLPKHVSHPHIWQAVLKNCHMRTYILAGHMHALCLYFMHEKHQGQCKSQVASWFKDCQYSPEIGRDLPSLEPKNGAHDILATIQSGELPSNSKMRWQQGHIGRNVVVQFRSQMVPLWSTLVLLKVSKIFWQPLESLVHQGR